MTQLTNSAERETAKQDRSGARTASDVIRRIPDMDKVIISAKQIEMEGYTTINGGFQIDESGDMTCNNATINNARINNALMKTTAAGNIAAIEMSTEEDIYDGQYTRLFPAIIEIHNDYDLDSPAAVIEPQLRLYWEATGDSTLIGAAGCYSPIFQQTSSEKLKKNFEKFENGLDIIKNIDIYKYNLKSELDECKKHIGFVIGNDFKYSKEITSDDNTRVDLYSFISVCCKAIQEQQKEIEELKKVIK